MIDGITMLLQHLHFSRTDFSCTAHLLLEESLEIRDLLLREDVHELHGLRLMLNGCGHLVNLYSHLVRLLGPQLRIELKSGQGHASNK